jgi:hypothetical protein
MGLCVARRASPSCLTSLADLPTSRWPMRSRPQELATIIGDSSAAFEEPTGAEFEHHRALT